jgi:hypothetical protein
MDNENRIEFYQNRSFGERLSAAAEFLRQNWKVFIKNILVPAIPLVLLAAFTLPGYFNMVTLLGTGDVSAAIGAGSLGLLFFLAAMCLSLYLYAMSGAIMKVYEEGNLTDKTSWSDLSGKMFSNAGKIFLIGLATFLLLLVIVAGLAFLIGSLASNVMLLSLILMVLILVVIPPMVMVIFPAIFRGASTWASIKKGVNLGLKNWGSTFGIVIIAGIMAAILSYIFGAPLQIWIMFNPAMAGGTIYVLGLLSMLGTVFATPFMFVFLAFQYFSITEKEEGVSLQNKIDEFDNL